MSIILPSYQSDNLHATDGSSIWAKTTLCGHDDCIDDASGDLYRACVTGGLYDEHYTLGKGVQIASFRYQYGSHSNNGFGPIEYKTVYNRVFEYAIGRVVAVSVHYDRRVMSDVWDNVPYAIVLNDDGTYTEASYYSGGGDTCWWYQATVDASQEQIDAYQAHLVKVKLDAEKARKEAAEAYEADRAAKAAKAAKTAAKKEAKEQAARQAAQAELVNAPAKGTKVKVNATGIIGNVFWSGVTKYYGKINAKVGVKDAKGIAHWCLIGEITPV